MSFRLSRHQQKQLNLWIEDQNKKVALKQNRKAPNYGACGGVLSYTFTPTTICMLISVKNTITGDTLDLSELDHDFIH